MASVPSWLWWAVGWALLAIGVWYLLTGRGVPARVRARFCRRCRYDMKGIASLTCPECGWTARNERQTQTRGPLKQWRLLGIALVGLGWTNLQLPGVLAHGWVRSVPDWALAWWAPTDGTLNAENSWTLGSNVVRTYFQRASSLPAESDILYNEAFRRLRTGEFSVAFGSSYLKRMQASGNASVSQHAMLPQAWPWDVPLPLQAMLDRSGSLAAKALGLFTEPPFQLLHSASAMTGPSQPVTVTISVQAAERVYTGVAYEAKIDTTRGRANFMAPVRGEDADALVRAALRLSLSIGRSGPVRIECEPDQTADQWSAVPFYTGLSLRVQLRGETLGTARLGLPPYGYTAGDDTSVTLISKVAWLKDGESRAEAEADQVEIEVTGDAALATDVYTQELQQTRLAWVGTLRIKPTVERRFGK